MRLGWRRRSGRGGTPGIRPAPRNSWPPSSFRRKHERVNGGSWLDATASRSRGIEDAGSKVLELRRRERMAERITLMLQTSREGCRGYNVEFDRIERPVPSMQRQYPWYHHPAEHITAC